MMSTYLARPRRGHLEKVHHIFGYLKSHPKRKLFFDPQHPSIDERSFNSYDSYGFYHDIKEVIPEDMPSPRGQSVSMHCFVNADHAGNSVTRRSLTSFLLFVNHAPIVWFSKWQNTVKTSTFGSDFIAMKTAVEQTESLCYKIRMFGIPVEDPMNGFCDNKSIFKNLTIPDLTLKKIHTSICYHQSREAVASGTMWVAKEGMATNLANLSPSPWQKQDELFYLSSSRIRWGVGFSPPRFPTSSQDG